MFQPRLSGLMQKTAVATHRELVDFLKVGMQKQESQRSAVDAFKGLLKEARAGHPNNVAFAKALQPGLLPGIDGTRMRFIHQGDPIIGQKLAAMFRAGTDPDTLEYLHGMEKGNRKK